MPHRSGDHGPPPQQTAGYNPHVVTVGAMVGGTVGASTHPQQPSQVHMMNQHPSDAVRMAAFQHATRAYSHPMVPSHHPQTVVGGCHARMAPPPPPMMWHPADAAAHLARADIAAQQQHAADVMMSSSSSSSLVHSRASEGEVQQHMERSAFANSRYLKASGGGGSMEETPEEAAASALLMASNGPRASPKQSLELCTDTNPVEADEVAPPPTPSSQVSREPPKKRKKHLDVLRRNQIESNPLTVDPATGSPCHVSPGSASSSRDGEAHHTDEIVTVVTTQSSRTLLETSSGSYDTRESKKELDTSSHFPTILHKVLEMPDAKSILQWLPSGQAWKIVRWDALRREVLPRHFPDLCKGEDGVGSMDSFLWQVRAWGFEEITDGDDAGAYRHVSFIRDTPKLCTSMTFAEGSPRTPMGKPTEGSKDSKSQESQSILQVPSLTSRSDGEQEPTKQASTEQPRVQFTNSEPSNASSGMHDRVSPVYPGWQHGGMAMRYRTRDGGYADPRLVHQTSPVRNGVTFPPPYSPRFPFRTPGGPPSPLKSGRGGSRLASRNSFPVSQRGKGTTRARLVRSPISTSSTLESSPGAKKEPQESESPGLGPHLQKESLATNNGISRKTNKRKLPLASRKAAEQEAAVASEAQAETSPMVDETSA